MPNILIIAIRNLFGEKGRLFLTSGGVAFSVMLILLLIGLYFGWSTQITRFLGNISVDMWLGQKGSRDMSHTVSILPASLASELAKYKEVESVTPFIGRQVSFTLEGEEAHLFLIGADDKEVIRPYETVEGKKKPERGEIIIDRTFAKEKNLKIGDTLEINSIKLKISGISAKGNLLVYTYALAHIEDVKNIFNSSEIVNYYIVRSGDVGTLKAKISGDFPNLEIMSKEKFLENNASILQETFLPIIGVLAIIALAIGTAVIGLTIYTATIEKSREYGVLKAIGYNNGQLFGIAFVQSLIASIVGFLLGIILASLVALLAQTQVSGFVYEAGVKEIVAVFAATLLMSLTASFIPLKRITSIDPAQVFKA